MEHHKDSLMHLLEDAISGVPAKSTDYHDSTDPSTNVSGADA
jgi:hypothetical protein